jgi:hypothetical protein
MFSGPSVVLGVCSTGDLDRIPVEHRDLISLLALSYMSVLTYVGV